MFSSKKAEERLAARTSGSAEPPKRNKAAEQRMNPVELAHAAKDRGDILLQVQITEETPLSMSKGVKANNGAGVGPVLSEIEQVGWRLEHVSTAYMRHKDAHAGALALVYVFRNTEH